MASQTSDAPQPLEFRSLVLVGGQSSRMGIPKHELHVPQPSTTHHRYSPLLLYTLAAHGRFYSSNTSCTTEPIWISARDAEQVRGIQALLQSSTIGTNFGFITDTLSSAGPTAGLYAAHLQFPNSHWLVTGCDYPFLSTHALQQLYDAFVNNERAVTCFVNPDGKLEPLLAIWSPRALSRLVDMVQQAVAKIGPTRVLRTLEGEAKAKEGTTADLHKGICTVSPLDPKWISGVNTPIEWRDAREEIETALAIQDPQI